MQRPIIVAITTLILTAIAKPAPQLQPDFSNGGDKRGNGAGAQFITGPCDTDADCSSDCCAGLMGFRDVGICSGPAVGTAQGKTGCGFPNPNAKSRGSGGGAGSADSANTGNATTGGGLRPDFVAGGANQGNGAGAQFITGPCESNADCASGCCAGLTGFSDVGICSGPAVGTAQGKTGCGFPSPDSASRGDGAQVGA